MINETIKTSRLKIELFQKLQFHLIVENRHVIYLFIYFSGFLGMLFMLLQYKCLVNVNENCTSFCLQHFVVRTMRYVWASQNVLNALFTIWQIKIMVYRPFV